MYDVISAWSLLSRSAVEALIAEDGASGSVVVRMIGGLAIADAPLLTAVTMLLRGAVENGGLPLTERGNLTRADVRRFATQMAWPETDFIDDRLQATLNEPDVVSVHAARIVAEDARLLRKRGKRLVATKRGAEFCEPGAEKRLYETILRCVLWRVDPAYFDGSPIEGWPRDHLGVVLWGLRVSAHRWESAETLRAICAFPCRDAHDEEATIAFELRVLRTLVWLGLLERRTSPVAGASAAPSNYRQKAEYRKTPLFDSALGFRVRPISPESDYH